MGTLTPSVYSLTLIASSLKEGAFWYGANSSQKLSPFTGKVARSAERGTARGCRVLRDVPPQLRLRSAERWLEYGRLAALPLAILPIPPDSPLAASPTGRARLESPFRAGLMFEFVPHQKAPCRGRWMRVERADGGSIFPHSSSFRSPSFIQPSLRMG